MPNIKCLSTAECYAILYHFMIETECTAEYQEILKDCLKFDIFINDYGKTLPDWLEEAPDEKQKRWDYFNHTALIQQKIPHLAEQTPKQLSKRCYIGFFHYDIFSENKCKKETVILFDYGKRDIITAKYMCYQLV